MTTALSNFRDIVHLIHRVVRPDALHSMDLHILVNKIHDAVSREDCCSPLRVESFPYHELLRPPTPPTLVIHPDQEMGEIVPNVIVTKEEPAVHEIRNVVIQAPRPTPLFAGAATPCDAAILIDLHRDYEEADAESLIERADTPTATSQEEDDIEPDADSESDVEPDSDDDSESDDESESDEEEDEEDEAKEEVAEEEDEDEDLQLLKIKKQKYYWSPSSHRIYECLEEGYGDCIGTYDGSKIIPKS